MNYTHPYPSPLGNITLASNGEQLTGLWFDGQKYFGSTLTYESTQKNLPIFDQAGHWLDIYFSGISPDFTPPFSLKATPFCKTVWSILRTVPYGQTITYGEVSRQIARQKGIPAMSPQAVGNAVARNPISLVIPCHRVIGSNGSLTGYAGGIDKKVKLLSLEKADMANFFIPTKGTAL